MYILLYRMQYGTFLYIISTCKSSKKNAHTQEKSKKTSMYLCLSAILAGKPCVKYALVWVLYRFW